MTLEDLAKLVREMRDAQSQYFRTRQGNDLERARKLERQVDQAVSQIHGAQPSLFDPSRGRR